MPPRTTAIRIPNLTTVPSRRMKLPPKFTFRGDQAPQERSLDGENTPEEETRPLPRSNAEDDAVMQIDDEDIPPPPISINDRFGSTEETLSEVRGRSIDELLLQAVKEIRQDVRELRHELKDVREKDVREMRHELAEIKVINNRDPNDADDEDDDKPIRPGNTGRKTKPAEVNILKENVREHTRTMMKRENACSPYPDLPEHAVSEYNADPSDSPGPTVNAFMIDLNGTAGSPWNSAITELFVKDFIEARRYECRDKSKIKTAFIVHMRYLITEFKKQVKDPSGMKKGVELQRKAQTNRRLNVYYRRRNVIVRTRELRHHLDMITNLGPEGMTSDESGYEGTKRTYYVRRKSWRSSALTAFLRDLDVLYVASRLTTTRQGNNASLPRVRYTRELISTRKPVPGLPASFYCDQWKSKQNSGYLGLLDIQEDAYDLTHPPTIAQFLVDYRSQGIQANMAGAI